MSLFSAELKEKYHVIKSPANIDVPAVRQFEAFQKHWVQMNMPLHIIDLHATQAMDDAFVRAYAQFKNVLKTQKCAVAAIRVPLRLLSLMKQKGVEDIFSPLKSIEEACSLYNIPLPAAPKIDVNFLNPFLAAIVAGFSQVESANLKTKDMRIRKEKSLINEGIVAALNLNSKTFRGAIRLSFETGAAISVYNGLVSQNVTSVDGDVVEFISNFIQTVFTKASAELKKTGHQELFDAFPSLFEVGPGSEIPLSPSEISILVECQSNIGNFFVEIVFEPRA